ncbi:TRAP transporter large permease [Rhodovulum sulfidophilum]|uniref:TRAP transporter large permease protein n=1 Tax=Rhodovulum sulfidophilum TaxID=35806 RepID=A0A0D6AX83_RHOSU|nr:TRAP transporter large permease [Rhodovulum sulfidophilum]MBL3564131.1 TRAP transporter large permease [Rhodovulum sulfidophilum]MBL3573284.1 TRAP transporter large permease [Rhodovulum sulfidophilum]MBL3585119.1 TRAP transporter large permease [Rhodovulum sulfidophilum]MBL3608333.1 TRAP transporter large permease [Rhodovulum sulfidophilum]MCE8433689.1 TRAP transporter large permease [Rhodovulum sulfidophilum]
MSLLLFGLFFLFLILGLPVALAIGGATMVAMQAGGVPLLVLPQQMFSGINSFALVAVPMFILAGDIMAQGKVSARLVALADALIGFLKGGLSIVSVLAAMFFAAISGSGAATTAAVSSTLVPELTRKGYDPASAASLIAAGGTIGVVIPPSVPMIIYAVIAQESVSALFLNGFLPGIAMGAGLMVVALVQGHKRAYPKGAPFSLKTIWRSFVSAFWGLMTPVIILGGIFSGVFTPSEAAVIAVNYAILVSLFVYRDMGLKDIYRLMVRSGVTTAVIMFVISASAALSWALSNWQVPAQIGALVLSVSDNPMVVLAMMLVLILVTGIFIETASALIILTPLLLPLALQMGVDAVHFGVILVVGLAIGMITPPVAINLYVASSVTGQGLERIAKAVLPYLAVLVAVLILVTYLPVLAG